MHLAEVQEEILAILTSEGGRFLTAYQVCQKLEIQFPLIWKRLISEYSSSESDVVMGYGAGYPYSPASFIANALRSLASQQPAPIVQEELVCNGISVKGVAASPSADFVGIWAALT